MKKKLLSVVILMVYLAVCVTFGQNNTDLLKNLNGIVGYDNIEVHFIDVGQGDCILVKNGDEAMLIDAGDDSKGTKIQLYLKKQGITKLDYFLITHPDSDHCGGADVILYKFDCDKVLMTDFEKDTTSYKAVLDTLELKNYKVSNPKVGDRFKLGKSTFTILGPLLENPSSNNNSIVIRLENGKTSFLFSADAEKEEEDAIAANSLNIESDVLKIGHHGSSSSTSDAYLEKINPKYCVISCGAENDYGHPHAEVLDRLRKNGCRVFRTDEQGSIIAYSDGKRITFNCSPSTTWKSGENVKIFSDLTIYSYIANKNTHKFHKPECEGVKDMKEKNKWYFDGDRESLIEEGYKPCQRCKP